MLDIWNEDDGQDGWWEFLIGMWQYELEVLETQIHLWEWTSFFEERNK